MALAVLATIAARVLFPFGGLLVGLSFAYIVWGDSPKMKYRFSMLAVVTTITWAFYLILATGLFSSVTNGSTTTGAVHAPAGWVAPH